MRVAGTMLANDASKAVRSQTDTRKTETWRKEDEERKREGYTRVKMKKIENRVRESKDKHSETKGR